MGVAYQFGRDKKFRPILHVSFRDKDTEDIKITALQNALEFIMLVIKRFMLIPKYVEQWVCVVDLADLSAFSIDVKILKSIVDVSRENFMGCLHKIYLYDVSSSCKFALTAVKAMMAKRTSDKIHILQ